MWGEHVLALGTYIQGERTVMRGEPEPICYQPEKPGKPSLVRRGGQKFVREGWEHGWVGWAAHSMQGKSHSQASGGQCRLEGLDVGCNPRQVVCVCVLACEVTLCGAAVYLMSRG